ncbi:MAG: hypothetical protein ABIP51_02215 [Bacteroidia bacterium]
MVKNIGLYIFIQLTVIVLLAVALSSIKLKGIRLWSYFNENVISEGGQAKLMFSDLKNFVPDDNTIFVIGSSHAYRGYDPRNFEKAGFRLFNMGTSGQNMKDSYTLIKVNKSKIKRLIVDIYPGVLQDVTEESTLMLIQNSDNNNTAFTILKNNITINSINNIAARVCDIYPKPLPYAEKYITNGYVQKDNVLKSDSNTIYGQFSAGTNFPYLDSILSFSTKNNIDVSLASHPLKWNNAYKQYYNNTYLPVLKTVLNKYPTINFYDHTFLHSNSDSLFSDVNHLNQKGVNWYNKKLLQDIKSLTSGK